MRVYMHTNINVTLKAFQSPSHPCIANTMLGTKDPIRVH